MKLLPIIPAVLVWASPTTAQQQQQKVLRSTSSATRQIEHENEIILKDNEQGRNLKSTRCGCNSCDTTILNTNAGSYSVVSRIDWVKRNLGKSENQACEMICGEEFPEVCGSQCAPSQCSAITCDCPSSCTRSVLSRNANGHSVESRIDWVMKNLNKSQTDACGQVCGNEYPNVCGECDPDQCGGGPVPAPTPNPPTGGGGGRPKEPFNEVLNSNIRNRGMLPYLFDNKSTYSESDIYIAIVGRVNNQWVWLDLADMSVRPMASTPNTILGPSHDQSSFLYADIFSKLSDVSSNTVGIPRIASGKMFVSFKNPLYLHLFPGEGGFTQPNLENRSDPNRGIRFETLELTWAPNGLWINTSRVDAYQYPMGLEVYGRNVGGSGSNYKKVGELKRHSDILALWPSRVSSPFQPCYNTEFFSGDGIIKQPSKIPEFDSGGASELYFQGYINQIWNTYKGRNLKADFGDLGIWEGRVSSNNVFTMSWVSGSGRRATGKINGIPNTQEVIEAKGKMHSGGEFDKNVQKMFAAAINRHAIDPNLPSSIIQRWGDRNRYYRNGPFNDYAAFFHKFDISFNSETYAFSYDDVFEQSSTIQATSPEKIRITIGGFWNVSD